MWNILRDENGQWHAAIGNEFPPPYVSIPKGSHFWRLDLGKEYRWDDSPPGSWIELTGAGAGLIVQEADGVPSGTADTLQFDQADGFVLTDLGAQDFRVDLAAVPETVLALNFPTHAAVSLAADADVLLGLSGQQLNLDPQVANAVLAGPASAGPSDPTFRALVDADIPAAIARDAEVTSAIAAHEAAADPHTVYQKESEKDAASGYAGLDTSSNVNAGEVATTSIEDDAVTYAKMQNVSATDRFLGRKTAGAGDPEELTGAEATARLDVFTSALKGLAPLSGGGTTNFLRADGTWNAPSAAPAPDQEARIYGLLALMGF